MQRDNNSNLLLPGDPEFDKWLCKPPPNWQDHAARNDQIPSFAITPDSSVLTEVTQKQLDELMYDANLYLDEDLIEDELFYDHLIENQDLYTLA